MFGGRDARHEFSLARIPGAQFFDLNACRDQTTDLPHMLPSLEDFRGYLAERCVKTANKMSEPVLSVDVKKARFVLYDSMGVWSAPRVWWMFKVFEIQHVFVLNGGLPQWIAENRLVHSASPESDLASETVKSNSVELHNVGLHTISVATRTDADEAAAPNSQFVLVDARPAGRFEGRDPEPRAGLPSGHIPGSKNLPWTSAVESVYCERPSHHLTGSFAVEKNQPISYLYYRYKTPEALHSLFAEQELAKSTNHLNIVMMCGSGVSAAILLLAYLVAYPGLSWDAVALYDGSWTEWKLHAMAAAESCK